MDREHIKGVADYAKGAIKETIGKITGDKQMQAEGKLDKVKGAVHNAVGTPKTRCVMRPRTNKFPNGGSRPFRAAFSLGGRLHLRIAQERRANKARCRPSFA